MTVRTLTQWKAILQKQTVFLISMVLAAFSCVYAPSFQQIAGSIDFRVLILLFCLMCVVEGFTQAHLLKRFAALLLSHIHRLRSLAAVLVGLCFFGSMLFTNDVALITFVPLTISMSRMTGTEKRAPVILVLQTLAANIGSSLTPVGNPQNLYLYNAYNMDTAAFFSATVPIVLFGGTILALCLLFIPAQSLMVPEQNFPPLDKRGALLYCTLFLVTLLTVFRILPVYVAFACVLFCTALYALKIFQRIDYFLLLTFVCFFIFVGNIGTLPSFRSFLESLLHGREILIGAAVSQVLSNVPAAMLLSDFTKDGLALLKGVNIGGCGTLIASLASLITYQLYSRECPEKKGKFFVIFSLFNIPFLLILLLFSLLL